MQQLTYQIRPIQAGDNPGIRSVIETVMPEFGAIGPGFSIADPEVLHMYENYQSLGSRYFVAVANETGEILGGAGIGPLQGAGPEYGELKKMYVLAEHRQRQVGRQLMLDCLRFAKDAKYHFIYLETLNTMKRAQDLYTAFGFQELQQAIGNTGHHGCDRYYLLTLDSHTIKDER